MKLFSKRTPEEKAAKTEAQLQRYDAQAREKAAKCDFDVTAAVAIGWDVADSRYEFLAVFPDRVEVFRASIGPRALRLSPESQVIPMSRVSSVRVERAGVFDKVVVTTSGADIGVKVGAVISYRIRDAILTRLT